MHKNTQKNTVMFETFFYSCCENNDMRLAETIFLEYDCINFQDAFEIACLSGSLDVAKWLFSISYDINISINEEYIFRNVCGNGHIDVVKWLLYVKPNIKYECKNADAFTRAAKSGHINICEFLFDIKPILFFKSLVYIFIYSCKRKNLELAKWAYTRNFSRYGLKNHFYFAKISCEHNSKEILKYLLELNKNVNYLTLHKIAYKHDKMNVLKYLGSLDTDIFFITNDGHVRAKSLKYTFSKVVKIDNLCICPICYEKNAELELICKHKYCLNCIDTWYNIEGSCPECRQDIRKIRLIKSL